MGDTQKDIRTEIHTDDATALARSLTALLDATRHRVGTGSRSALVERVTDHIGKPLADIPNVALSREAWEHVNLHEGVAAYVAEHSPDAAWFGVGGGSRGHHDLIDLLSAPSSTACSNWEPSTTRPWLRARTAPSTPCSSASSPPPRPTAARS